MRILGIDPGLAILGYSILEIEGNKMRAIDYGVIKTPSVMEFPERLKFLYEELNLIIKKYSPNEMAIEELFFNKNVKTAIKVGHARGVEILSARMNSLDIYEYTPLQIKNAITGYGRAEKGQIQQMVKMLLNLSEIPKPDDAADALAVAITHFNSLKYKEEFRLR